MRTISNNEAGRWCPSHLDRNGPRYPPHPRVSECECRSAEREARELGDPERLPSAALLLLLVRQGLLALTKHGLYPEP